MDSSKPMATEIVLNNIWGHKTKGKSMNVGKEFMGKGIVIFYL